VSKGYSPISARKMLEIGKKIKTDISVSSMVKKRILLLFKEIIRLARYSI